jgi:hypothetical protein
VRRGVWWPAAFFVVGAFVLVGAFVSRDGQRTWALVSTIAFVGLVALIAVYFSVCLLARLQSKGRRVLAPFRRR